MALLTLSLFGSPHLDRNGTAATPRRRKVMALLAYLAVTRQTHTRDQLTTLLWPEFDRSSARANLRRDLSQVKKIIGQAVLSISRAEIGMAAAADVVIDTIIFQNNLSQVRHHHQNDDDLCPDCAAVLQESVTLYKGDFMAGFTLADAPAFDEWQFFQGESLRHELAWGLALLVNWQQDNGLLTKGVDNGRRWVALDPLHEPAQRALMTAYELAGQHAAALRQYEECLRLLRQELGVAPEAQTTALFDLIRKRQLENEKPSASIVVKEQNRFENQAIKQAVTIPTPTVPLNHPEQGRHNLPLQVTPFIGREAELARLDALLADANVRLITIVGSGGCGKTRLALAAAERQLPAATDGDVRYPDGVFFVPLASLGQPEHIVPALAEALDIQLGEVGERTPRQQLLNYLSHKRLLLIMDNYEHLLAGVDLLADVVLAAPALQILVTSRERLQLQGEQLFPIGGLAQPEIEGREVIKAAAVQLFLQAARRIQPDFEMRGSHDLAHLVHICQQVDGMPLALELAAVWVDVLSLEAIAAEIQRSLDFLETTKRDVPNRHRSMRAVFNGSWNLLGANQQQMFGRLSVFRGGFTLEAAQAVARTSVGQLAQLVAKSLLQYDRATERYQMHELLRQFGIDWLADAQERSVRDKHSAHYCAFLQQKFEELKGPKQKLAVAEIQLELDNCRAAWAWAVRSKHIDQLAQAVNGLGQFLVFWRGRYQEPARLFQQAATLVDGSESVKELQLLLQLQIWGALCNDGLGRHNEVERLCQKCLTLLNQPPLSQLEYWPAKGIVLNNLALKVSFFDRITGNQLAEESRKVSQLAGDQWGEAKALDWLGILAHSLGNLSEAERLFKQSLAIHSALKSQSDIAGVLSHLAITKVDQNRLGEAERLIRDSVARERELGIQFTLVESLVRMSIIYILLGNYAGALAASQESFQIYGKRGHLYFISFSLLLSSCACFHLGRYEQAQRYGEQALNMARGIGKVLPTAKALRALGQVALARADYAQAELYLLESETILRTYGHTGMPIEMATSLCLLSTATLGAGKMKAAIEQVCEAIVIFERTKSVYSVLALAAGSLLLIELGQVERAIELYALAEGHPYVANSLWFAEICGQKIAAAATSFPPEAAERARTRGRMLDLMETMTQLRQELCGATLVN